jgi:hypothetical protein
LACSCPCSWANSWFSTWPCSSARPENRAPLDTGLIRHILTAERTTIAKPQRRRSKYRPYERALRQGRAGLSPGRTVEQQSGDHEAGAARNREISAKVRDLLKEKGIPARQFIRYNAFALHVDRYCRGSSDPHLNLAVSYIIAEFVCKGLAREVLVDTARVLFNIPGLY